MERAIIVRGKMSDPRHIELDEPVTEVQGTVEVVVRPLPVSLRHRSARREAWEEAFDAWVDGHDRSLPLIAPEFLRREAIHGERM